MKFVFRTDASLQIGTGHVMRCLTLADTLRDYGGECIFLCRDHVGNLIKKIENEGFKIHVLAAGHLNKAYQNDKTGDKTKSKLQHSRWLGVSQEQDVIDCQHIIEKIRPDWLIVDHYSIDTVWQKMLKPYYKKLMVIDDLGDRNHSCDLLLDQNYGSSLEKYLNRLPKYCTILTGPQYALLRPEFSQWRERSLKRRRTRIKIENLLISMGGIDENNFTGQILKQIQKLKPKTLKNIIVVLGEAAPHLKTVKSLALNMPIETTIQANISNMAQVMAESDLAIGAAGATTWERCCLGLPTIQLVVAENQKQSAYLLSKNSMVKTITSLEELSFMVTGNLSPWGNMGLKSAELTDGFGRYFVASRLLIPDLKIDQSATFIQCKTLCMSKVAIEDIEQIRLWRNHDRILRTTVSQKKITPEAQVAWFKGLHKKDLYLKINVKNTFIGVASLKFEPDANTYVPGVFIGEENYESFGYGFAAASLLTYYAFLCLRITTLHACILKENKAAIRLNKAIGYERLNGCETYDLYQIDRESFYKRFKKTAFLLNKVLN